MSIAIPRGSTAVMARRVEPPDSLDFFPTPPWATRALCEHVLGIRPGGAGKLTAWEPAAGDLHMADVLTEYFGAVQASDVHDYGHGIPIGSFVGAGPDVIQPRGSIDWIITNPPFKLATEFAERALTIAQVGVALLLRSVFIESAERYALFQRRPLAIFAPFAGRVAMVKGRWDPKASTATSYAWFVWGDSGPRNKLQIIPPDARALLTRPDDAIRFARAPA